DGKKRHPRSRHLSPTAAGERGRSALLEKAAAAAKAGKPPMLPVWLSPTQVRLVPVAADDVEYARTLVPRLEGIRVDLDDSGDSLGKKIRNAEKEWVPYIVVIGEKEAGGGPVSGRVGETIGQMERDGGAC